MATDFTVFGCCATRDVFNSNINYNYKDFFNIGGDAFHTSMISLMSKSFNYNSDSIKNFNETPDDVHKHRWAKRDFEKIYLKDLKKDQYEYLLLDTYFDVKHGVIQLNEYDSYITNSHFIHSSDFFKNLDDFSIITIHNNPCLFLKLWVESCNDFFNFIKNNCPSTKVILNPVRSSTMVKNSLGEVYENSSYKQFIPDRCYRSILDEYILNNFNVDVLIYGDFLLNENYFFGPADMHYTYAYFEEITNQLNNIIHRDNTLDFSTIHKIKNLKKNVSISKFNRDIAKDNQVTILNLIKRINDLENESMGIKYKLNSKLIRYWENFLNDGLEYSESLKKYFTARLDIKNCGNSDNQVKILKSSDDFISCSTPGWFEDSLGKGIIIQSSSGYLHMKIKCINEGELSIILRGPDIKNMNKERIPIFIDFNSLKINGIEYLNENKLLWMEDTYNVSKKVQDSECIDLIVEWNPLNSKNIF